MASSCLAMRDPKGILKNSKHWTKWMGIDTPFRHCRQIVSVSLFLLINLIGIRRES